MSVQKDFPGAIRKIAVLRANALGDFLFTLPALQALHTTYPQAEIVLLAKQWHADFLRGRPGPIDRVVVIPTCRGVGAEMDATEDPVELTAFFQRMQDEHFDLACQLHGGGHYSNPFLKRLGARFTIGLKTSDAPALDRWLPYIYFQHEILRYLEVVALVNARTDQVEPHLEVTESDRESLARVLPAINRPLVVLHPGASDAKRRWPAENFAAIGDILTSQGAQVILTGTQSEQPLTRTLRETMRTPAIDLAGRLSLGALAALLQRCQLVVSNDTGPLHLANAVGTASVGIFWCFNLVTAAPLLRHNHRPLTSWRLHCPICGADNTQKPCRHQVSFVADISVEEVRDAALELFSTGKHMPALAPYPREVFEQSI